MPKSIQATMLIFAIYLGFGAFAVVTAATHIQNYMQVQNERTN